MGDGQVFVYDQDGAPKENVSGLTTLDYTVDAAGRIVEIDDTLDNSFDQVFGYDLMDRLTSHTVTGWGDTLSYNYDAVGNRTEKRDGSDTGYNYAHGSTNNRLTTLTPVVAASVGSPQSMSYDANGSVIQTPGGAILRYDVTGRLVKHLDGAIVTTMSYDASGQRVRTHVNMGAHAGEKLEVYDLAGKLIGVYAPDGLGGFTVVEELVNLDGWRTVATVRPDATLGMAAPKIYSIVTDHLQAPRAIYSPSGDLVWTWRAPEAFGVTMPNENPSSLGVFKYDGRFPGQRFDNSTGFLHNGFRSYAPTLGRYLQSDPLGLEAGWNTYAYVGGNPVSYTDFWGLACDQRGCWNTPTELAYAENKDYTGYYQAVCAGGDPYACRAGEAAANDGDFLARATNARLQWSISERQDKQASCQNRTEDMSAKMEAIRQGLMAARVAQLSRASPSSPLSVNRDEIAEFHSRVFEANGASPDVFGGKTWDQMMGVVGWMGWQGWAIKQVAYDWCPAPSCSN